MNRRGEDEKRIHSITSDISNDSGSSSSSGLTVKKVKKYLYICNFAFMMNYSAYAGLIFLQSSMNIEEGLGTASLFAVYATSSLSTILIIPFLIDFMGPKAAIILGEIGIIAFTAANFYPSWFTMLPIAVFHGLTESASWAGAAVYVTHLGEEYWRLKCKKLAKVNKKEETYVYRFISLFYVFVYSAQVFGNALVYVVLFNLKDDNKAKNESSADLPITNRSALLTPELTSLNRSVGYDQCGSQECQSEFIYDTKSQEFEKYKPNQISIYLLLSVFFVMQIIFTIVHAFALPTIYSKFQSHSKSEEKKAMMTCRDDAEPALKTFSNDSGRIGDAVRAELKETFFHIISPLHCFVFPLIFYNGLFIAFNVTEFTRAYVSCTVGVEQIGLAMVVYGCCSMAISLLSTKLLPWLGRNAVMFVVLIAHLSVYLSCMLWEPTPDTWWVVYVMAGCLGCCDGVATNVTQALIAVYFQDRLGIAFSVKNFGTNLGIVAGTGISTSLCIYEKLYVLMGALFFSILMYVIAELIFKPSEKLKTKKRTRLTC